MIHIYRWGHFNTWSLSAFFEMHKNKHQFGVLVYISTESTESIDRSNSLIIKLVFFFFFSVAVYAVVFDLLLGSDSE